MAKTPQTVLAKKLQVATKKIVVGGTYVNHKDFTKKYKVLGLVILEGSDEIAVAYQAQYGKKLQFVRQLSSWLEPTEKEGKKVERFRRVG